MPRLSPSVLKQARGNPLLSLLLRECRDLTSARNELRWLHEHVAAQSQGTKPELARSLLRKQLHDLCVRRSKGVPLQYLLGTEFFGELELVCRPGVLIPRPETAASVDYLVKRLVQPPRAALRAQRKIRLLDLCTGSGCIPLLFRHLVQATMLPTSPADAAGFPFELECLGVDISESAIDLARHNELRTRSYKSAAQRDGVIFEQLDIMRPDAIVQLTEMGSPSSATDVAWDVLTCNPPYISPQSFSRDTSRSVRLHEPKIALVPPTPNDRALHAGDTFYPRVVELAKHFRCRAVLVEVADMAQAVRLANMFGSESRYHTIEIWRDEPQVLSQHDIGEDQGAYKIRGSGEGRSVFAVQGDNDAQ